MKPTICGFRFGFDGWWLRFMCNHLRDACWHAGRALWHVGQAAVDLRRTVVVRALEQGKDNMYVGGYVAESDGLHIIGRRP